MNEEGLIYLVIWEAEGYPEDREKHVMYAGTSKSEALAVTDKTPLGTTYLSLWRDGRNISEYMFGRWKTGTGPWEQNSGMKLDPGFFDVPVGSVSEVAGPETGPGR